MYLRRSRSFLCVSLRTCNNFRECVNTFTNLESRKRRVELIEFNESLDTNESIVTKATKKWSARRSFLTQTHTHTYFVDEGCSQWQGHNFSNFLFNIHTLIIILPYYSSSVSRPAGNRPFAVSTASLTLPDVSSTRFLSTSAFSIPRQNNAGRTRIDTISRNFHLARPPISTASS